MRQTSALMFEGSKYKVLRRLLIILGIGLSTLVNGLADCAQDCQTELSGCQEGCSGLIGSAYTGCIRACQTGYSRCIAACSSCEPSVEATLDVNPVDVPFPSPGT